MRDLNKYLAAFTKPMFPGRLIPAVIVAVLLTTTSAEAIANNEGIRVHGDWVVTVSEPGGTVVQEWVFSNALTVSGKASITRLLTGTHVMAFREDGAPAWDLLPKFDAAFNYGDAICTAEYSPESIVPNPQTTSSLNAELTANAIEFTLMRSFSLPEECLLAPSYSITSVTSYKALIGPFASFGDFSKKTINIGGILPDQVVTLKVTFSFQ